MPRDLHLGIRLTADAKGLAGEVRVSKKELDRLTGTTRQAGRAAKDYSQASGRMEMATRRAGRSFLAAHGKALKYLGFFGGIGGATNLFKTAVQNTIRQEQALAQVEARIASTGAAAGLASGDLEQMAAGLQQVTTYGDEAILEAQALLLSFPNIAGDVFMPATEAVLNLATGVGTDLRSAVIQLGKALDDPATGLDGLSRSGTKFTKEQQETIKALAETGRTAEAQALILQELQVQYGGAARAARDTLGGALSALSNTFGDLQELSTEATAPARQGIESINRELQALNAGAFDEELQKIYSICSVMGPVAPEEDSSRSPKAFDTAWIAPPSVSRIARAVSPYCRLSSSKIKRCAPAVLPSSIRSLMVAFCSSVNLVPALDRASRPVMGSSSALPSWMAALRRSVPSAVDRFRTASVAPANASPVMRGNDNRSPCASSMASSP